MTEKKSSAWKQIRLKHPDIARFLSFFVISNGVTILQVILMPAIKFLLDFTPLVHISFQIFPVGHNLDGSVYYVFDYVSGSISSGGGGGAAYFLAVEITLLTAQIINFFLQRSVTFKSNVGIRKAAIWYFAAWVIISVGAAALQGLYKAPIYNFMMEMLGTEAGATAADIVTMLINSVISFWVFFPIMKIIFKEK